MEICAVYQWNLLTMYTDDFRMTLTEQLKKSNDRCRHESAETITEQDDPLKKINDIDIEKRKIVEEFIESLISLQTEVTKEGHAHKYEAGLWTLRKSEKVTFCYKIINFSF